MTKQTNKGHYTHVFTQWAKSPTKLGAMPTEQQLALAHVFGRPGKQALGIAMALRDTGMSDAQMTGASALFDGRPTPCRNKIKGFVIAGIFDRANERGVIKITLTERGKAWVARREATIAAKAPVAPAKASKALARLNAEAKANKAKRVTKGANKAPAAVVVPATAENAPTAAPEAVNAIVVNT